MRDLNLVACSEIWRRLKSQANARNPAVLAFARCYCQGQGGGGGGLEEVLYRELQGLEEGLQRFQLEPILFTVTDCHGLLGYRSS